MCDAFDRRQAARQAAIKTIPVPCERGSELETTRQQQQRQQRQRQQLLLLPVAEVGVFDNNSPWTNSERTGRTVSLSQQWHTLSTETAHAVRSLVGTEHALSRSHALPTRYSSRSLVFDNTSALCPWPGTLWHRHRQTSLCLNANRHRRTSQLPLPLCLSTTIPSSRHRLRLRQRRRHCWEATDRLWNSFQASVADRAL